MVSYHAHNGPVKFLVVATTVPKTDRDKPRDSLPPGTEPPDGEQKDEVPSDGARPCLGQHSPDALWLGGSLGSVTHGSELSSSTGSLGPRSEDGTMCDLLRHPGMASGGGRRARRARVSSVLVATGGQGHRRLGRKARPQRPEELASSIMVWQIPLLSV